MCMKIQTKDFGTVEIDQQDIICFPKGIYAFEEDREFVFIRQDGIPMIWMQSVRHAEPRMFIFDPSDIVSGYHPVIPAVIYHELELVPNQQPGIYVIAVIPDDIKNMTVNLKSPIILNPEKKRAAQIILESGDYSVRHRVFGGDEGGRVPC